MTRFIQERFALSASFFLLCVVSLTACEAEQNSGSEAWNVLHRLAGVSKLRTTGETISVRFSTYGMGLTCVVPPYLDPYRTLELNGIKLERQPIAFDDGLTYFIAAKSASNTGAEILEVSKFGLDIEREVCIRGPVTFSISDCSGNNARHHCLRINGE